MTVYVDELFLVNFLVNYLVFTATARFSGMPRRRWRMLLAAAAGGLYAVFAYFSVALSSLPVKLISGVLLVFIAFDFIDKRIFLKRTLIFFLIAFVFGGAAMAAYIMTSGTLVQVQNGVIYTPMKPLPLLLITLAVTLFCNTFFDGAGRAARGGVSKVRVRIASRMTEFGALRDSGNSLRDTMTGAPVVIAELVAVQGLLDMSALEALSGSDAAVAVSTLAALYPTMRWRLMPYRAVGIECGMIAAFKPDSVEVDGDIVKGALLAITPTPLGASAGYCALVGIAP